MKFFDIEQKIMYWIGIISPVLFVVLLGYIIANSYMVKEGYKKIDNCSSFTTYGSAAWQKANESYLAGNTKLDRGGIIGKPCESLINNH